MAIVNRSFSVNVTPGMMPPIVHVSEYDVGRAYTVSILDEQGNKFTIPSGTTASIEGTLNGSVGFTQSATVSNNQVSFTLSESMTAYSGKAWCKIKLTLNDEPIQTCAFILAVDRAGVEADTVIGAPGFEEQIQEAVEDYLDDHQPFFTLPEGGQSGQALLYDDEDGAKWGNPDIETDDSLTKLGKAADAAVTGNIFDLLNMPHEMAEITWVRGMWGQSHNWQIVNNRVSPNPTIPVATGDTLYVKVGDGEKIALGIWTVTDGTYHVVELGSYQTTDLEKKFTYDCEITVAIAKTDDSAMSVPNISTTVRLVKSNGTSIVERVDVLWDEVFSEEDGVTFQEAYEYGEVTAGGNSYDMFPTGSVTNRLRAKREYIRKVPLNATSVTVSISSGLLYNGKYKIGWAFYTSNFAQIQSSIKGWYTSPTTFTADIPSNAVYYMVYIATVSNSAIADATEIDYSSASIVFNDSDTDHAKTPWYTHDEVSADAIPLTENPFLFSVNHRGYSTDAPENTLPAFIMSRKKGFRYVETDVLFTSDEVPVLLHDAAINRTARNADGTAISATTRIDSITFEQARTYDFGIWKNSKYAGTLIPSFAEFIQLCKQLSITPLIELKNETTWTDARIDSVAHFINAVGMQDHVAFISFSKDALSKMSVHFPRAMLGLGFEGTNNSANITALAASAAELKNEQNIVCVSVRNSTMTSELFEILENAGISSLVWTVNNERECANLHRNVIGVLSDSLNAGQIVENALINS